MKIAKPIARHQTRVENIFGKTPFLSFKQGSTAVIIMIVFIMITVVVLVGSSITEAKRCDRAEAGVNLQRYVPAHFDAAHDQTVVAEKTRVGYLGINEIPRVKMFIIHRPEAGEILASFNFKTAGNIDNFPEEFF